MPDFPSPLQNRILNALAPADQARLLPHLMCMHMPAASVLCEAGSEFDGLYFPVDCSVSLLSVMEDGSGVETAITGNDGVVGISLFMGGGITTSRAVVQHAGYAYRLRAAFLHAEFALGGRLQFLLLRYAQALLTQMAQTMVCIRHHRVEQQLCRWLLQHLDVLSESTLQMTQEQIAHALGVRREAITEVAGRLQADGLIVYRRGHIRVLDRAGLMQRVCECYAVVRNEYQRLLPVPD